MPIERPETLEYQGTEASSENLQTAPRTPRGQGTEGSQEAAGRGVMRRPIQSGQEDDENGQEDNDNERRGRGMARPRRRRPNLNPGRAARRIDTNQGAGGKAPPPALYDTTLKY